MKTADNDRLRIVARKQLATASALIESIKHDPGIKVMSTAYFIVLDSEEPGFDVLVDGKVLTKQLRAVNNVARDLGLKQLEDYAFQDLSDFGGPEMEPTWFDATEGKSWASRILQHIRENPNTVSEVDEVIADLTDYVRVFEEADKRGLKWHLELDF